MAKSTNTPSKTTSQPAAKKAATKRSTTSKTTSASTKKTEEKKPAPRTSRTISAKKTTATEKTPAKRTVSKDPQKTAPSNTPPPNAKAAQKLDASSKAATPTATQSASPKKVESTPLRSSNYSEGNNKAHLPQRPVAPISHPSKKTAASQKTENNRPSSKESQHSNPKNTPAPKANQPHKHGSSSRTTTTSRPAQSNIQKKTESTPSRSSNYSHSNNRTQPSSRPGSPRPEQRQIQKPSSQPWQQQNRPLPSPPAQPAKQEQKSEAPYSPDKEINIKLDQSVAILIDGNNIEMSLHSVSKNTASMINFDKLIPYLLGNRALSRLIYFREGKSISPKLAERLQKMFHGSVVPCHKSADIPLSIKAVQVASKVDTIIILSGDADYVELVRHLKHDGIRVEIAAFPETTADILRQESDYFFPITVDYSFALK